MPNRQNAINIAIPFIQKCEGLASKSSNGNSYFSNPLNVSADTSIYAYPDTGGVYTIGWGTIKYNVIDNRDVAANDVITKGQADLEFNYEVNQKENALYNYGGISQLNDVQYAALISLAYNAGEGAAEKMIDYINSHNNISDVVNYWKTFRIVDRSGNVVSGLINRREDETLLYTGQYNSLYSYYLRNKSNIQLLLYGSVGLIVTGALIYKIFKLKKY